MPRLIDADALGIGKANRDCFDDPKYADGWNSAIEIINNAPTIEAEPVRHGRWESVKNPQWPAYSHDKCSLCGWWNTKNALCYDGNKKPGHSLNYCPNCGAKMDGDTE